MEFNKDEIRKDINEYLRIISWFNNVDVRTDIAFQDFFLAHYKINLKDDCRLTYFNLLEKSKEEIITFEDVIKELCLKHNVVDARASAILINTRNPYAPKVDDYILRDLGIKKPENNVDSWIKTYNVLLKRFEEDVEADSSKYIVKVFDKDFPEYKEIPITKKIDEVLWTLKDLSVFDLYQEILVMINEK